MEEKRTSYKDAGVDIVLGDDASKILYNASTLTWKNRKGRLGEVVELFSNFSGLRAIHVGGLPEGTYMGKSPDGVGTKIELGERIAKHDTVAYDLFAMVCDDAVVKGGEPVVVDSVLDVKSLGTDEESYIGFVKQLAKGYIDAAKEANVAVIDGETAELGYRVGGYCELPDFLTRLKQSVKYLFKGEFILNPGFNYNWCSSVSWFAKKDRLLTGHEIQERDLLVGLKEDGFRSNGLSLVRKIMEKEHGNKWHEQEYKGKGLAELALHPSRIYTRAVVDMFGGFDGEARAGVHGVAHITGGSIPGKLGRVLKPSGLGALIDNPFEPCDLMLYCQEKGNVSDEEAYRTWNMRQGMIVITPEVDKVMEIAEEHGIESKVIGSITEEKGIRIKNKGYFKSNSNNFLNF